MEPLMQKMYRSQGFPKHSLRAVPDAPDLNAVPDIDSFLSAGGDAFFDVNPSQVIRGTQQWQRDAVKLAGADAKNVNSSGDHQVPSKKAKVYPVIHKVDPKLVSRNGKKSSSFAVPMKRPQGSHLGSERPVYTGEDDLYEDAWDFQQTDSLYTPAPLIVPVCSQAQPGRMKLRSVSEIIKMVGMGSDGASNMTGVRSGLSAILKQEVGNEIINVHCLAHRLELAFRDIVKSSKLYDKLITLLIGLHNFYIKQYKNKSGLQRAIEVLNINGVLPPKVTGTRWLPHVYRGITSLLRTFKAYEAHLSTCSHMNPKAEGLLKIMLDKNLMAFTLFLHDVLDPLMKLSLKLQKEGNTIADSLFWVEATVELLQNCKSRDSKEVSDLIESGQFEGIALKGQQPSMAYKNTMLDGFCDAINKRFQLEEQHIINATRILNFKNWPSANSDELQDFGVEEVTAVAGHFRKTLQRWEFDEDEALNEWRMLKIVLHKRVKSRISFSGVQEMMLYLLNPYPAETYRSIFDFPYFNIVQSKVFDDVMYTDKSLVLCSPTGSGKTAVFEMAIVRLMTRSSSLNSSVKIVYMAPIKALCSERYNDWKNKFEPHGLKCMELTGDTDVDDFYRLQEVQVILTTPEKWDSMTRKWRDNKGIMQAICLFLIDEIHILNDPTRGSTVEAVITRMKTIQAARTRGNVDPVLPPLRLVAVSATITNIDDVAEWLGSNSSRAISYKMDDSVRPVRLRKVILGYFFSDNKHSEFQFDLTLSYKLAGVIKTYSEDKPTLVFCSTRKSAQQSAEILSKDMKSSFIKSSQHRQLLNNLSFHIKDGKLKDLICKGIGYHHAGMDLQDRKSVEETFASGNLPVLVSTSTLAMGVNLPAHLVVVKSTMFYNLGVYQEYIDTQVLQMIGRAGRPQFDTSATAVIMTKNQTKMKYENLLNGTQMIESSLHKNLIEHLNAEVVLHTISDITVALEWLRHTFLYIRVFKNPKHYGLPLGLSRDSIEKRLQDMCMKDLKQLNGLDLIAMDEENLDVIPKDGGRLMARYCISFKTMQLFLEIKGAETVAELVVIISRCQEFVDIQLRTNEKKTLNTLNRDKNRITIRYPMQGKIKSTDMKVNCLLQAAFGCLMVQDFPLQQDMSRIFRAGIRVTRCLVELLWKKSDFKALLSAIQLCKCFQAKLWEDSKFVSKQLDGIGPAMSNALVNAGVTTFEKIEEMNPREIELIVNRHPPFGNQVRESVSCLPKYELVIEQLTKYAVNTSEIMISIQLSNGELLKEKPSTNHTCTLLIGDQDNTIVYKQRIMDALLLKEGQWSKRLDIKHAAKGPDLFIHYISQEWVGLDVECTFTPNYLGGKRITNNPSSLGPQMKGPSNTPAPKNEKGDNYVPCNHQCHNKQSCAHECCKTGVSSRKRQQRTSDSSKVSSDSNKMSSDRSKMSCSRGVMDHISEITSRASCMPHTPGRLKRTKLEFRTESSTPVDARDLSMYSFTPKQPMEYNPNINRPEADFDNATEMTGDWDTEADVGQDRDVEMTAPESNMSAGWTQLDMFQKHREKYNTDTENYEDDHQSLPDLTSNDRMPDEEPCWDLGQDDQREEDFSHETEFGYFYVNGDDMSKLPAEWEDQLTENSQARGIPKQNSSNNSKPRNSTASIKHASRKPLFQRPANAYGPQDKRKFEGDNMLISADEDNDIGIIEAFDSDGEQNGSRWTGYVDSQSSTDTDYLNQQVSSKIEKRNFGHIYGQSSESRNICVDGQNLQDLNHGKASFNLHFQNQKIGSDPVAHRMAKNHSIFGHPECSSFKRNVPETNHNPSSKLQRRQVMENKENVLGWYTGRRQPSGIPLSSNASQNTSGQGCDDMWGQRHSPYQVTDPLLCDGNKGQNHKLGQVLAWVSNSRNKPEVRSESDWEEWSDEAEILMGSEQNSRNATDHIAGDSNKKAEVRENPADERLLNAMPVAKDSESMQRNEKQLVIKSCKEQVKQAKQGRFSSFFCNDEPKDTVDSFCNIFDGIF